MRGPTFQLLSPFALEALNTVAPRTPGAIGFGAVGSKVEKRLNSSESPDCQSNRTPIDMFSFLVSLMSSLIQGDEYLILGMYLNGAEKLALSTWPSMKEANSFPVAPPFRTEPEAL